MRNSLLLTIDVHLVPMPLWGERLEAVYGPRAAREMAQGMLAYCDGLCLHCAAPADGTDEEWDYDDLPHPQWLDACTVPPVLSRRLSRVLPVCTVCRLARHPGMAEVTGRGAIAHERLAALRGWDLPTTVDHIEARFAWWRRASVFRWETQP